MENSKENESKYDISKSNFFANIPENQDNEPKNEIKEKSLDLSSTPISSKNQQIPQNNFSNFNNFNNNNLNNINYANNTYNNPSYINNNNFLSSQNYNPQYQMGNLYQNQPINYQNNMYYYHHKLKLLLFFKK